MEGYLSQLLGTYGTQGGQPQPQQHGATTITVKRDAPPQPKPAAPAPDKRSTAQMLYEELLKRVQGFGQAAQPFTQAYQGAADTLNKLAGQ